MSTPHQILAHAPFSSPERPAWSDPKIERAMRRLTARVDKELDADRRFFARRPERSFRVRRAYTCEEKQFRLAGVASPPAWLPGRPAMFIAVEQVAPGCRFRSPFWASSHLDTDVDEEAAKEVHRFVSPPCAQQDALRKAAREAYR